jgi:hypothetical protein
MKSPLNLTLNFIQMNHVNNNTCVDYSSIIAIATSCTEECITFITKNYKNPEQKKYTQICKDCVFQCIVLTDICTSDSPAKSKALQECLLTCEQAAYAFSLKQTENRHESNFELTVMFNQFAAECRRLLRHHIHNYHEVIEEPPAPVLN